MMCGIVDLGSNTIRLSIGTENIEDILDDLKGGFEALRASGLAK